MLKALTAEENVSCRHGLFFQDGQRHVDYILTYPVREPDGGCSRKQSQHQLTENDVTHSRGTQTQGGGVELLQTVRQEPSSCRSVAGVDVEKGGLEETLSSQEDQKSMRRQEFEEKLRKIGLELERDEEVRF